MISKEEITGIILAGGHSKRLGEEKGLCKFNRKPLVEYTLDTLQPLCGTIFISANNHLEQYRQYGFPVIPDDIPHIGPLGGIMSCLRRVNTQHNLVLSCDTPFVNTSILRTILQQVENFQVVVPSHETFLIEPLCAYYATNVLSEIEASVAQGDLKMMHLLKKIRYKSVAMEQTDGFKYGLSFLNINRREDLLQAAEIIKEQQDG